MQNPLSLIAFLLLVGMSIPSVSAQTSIQWPADVLNGACDMELSDLNDVPLVTLDSTCTAVQVVSTDEVLEGACDQETWVDRLWTVTTCDTSFIHTQLIRLRDTEPPYVSNEVENGGHYCSSGLDWLPLLKDNCDGSLQGGIVFHDTLYPCQGILSFSIALNIPDDCGNVLDTAYTVFLHDSAPPAFSSVPEDAAVECGDTPVLEFPEFEDCGGLSLVTVDSSSDPSCSGSTLFRTFTLTDACGASSTAYQTVESVDSTAPTILLPSDVEVSCDEELVLQPAQVSDACSAVVVEETVDTLVVDCGVQLVRHVLAYDACGNSAEATQVLTQVPALIPGCIDQEACNFNPQAEEDDGSCLDSDECGECGGTSFAGCTDPVACNYNPLAGCDDGSCEFSPEHYNCQGECLLDVDGDGLCDDVDECIGVYDGCGVCNGDSSLCSGCTDDEACNYSMLSEADWVTNFGLTFTPDTATLLVLGSEGDYAFEGTLVGLSLAPGSGDTLVVDLAFVGTLTVDLNVVVGSVSTSLVLANGLASPPETASFAIHAGASGTSTASWVVTATLSEMEGEFLSGTVESFSLALFDDGSCTYPDTYFDCDGQLVPSSVCGEGTVFDAASGTCIPSENCLPNEEACGPNTVWNPDLALCVPATVSAACYFDSDQNGNVGISDLLNLLSAYGDSCQ